MLTREGAGRHCADYHAHPKMPRLPESRIATGQGLAALVIWASTVALSRSLAESAGALTGPAVALALGGALSLGLAWVRGQSPMALLKLGNRYLLGCGAL
ncbi:MAG: hypothetical protein HY901_01305, partial [Deltaproteobacteria bacterium]|nr:hypothetical protein [Deltaproteobacteria bacterium]